jgi:hypothetical protein
VESLFEKATMASYWLTFCSVQLIMNKNDVFPNEKKVAGVDEVVDVASVNGFTDATFSSLSMILVSEVCMGVNVTIQSLNFSAAVVSAQDWDCPRLLFLGICPHLVAVFYMLRCLHCSAYISCYFFWPDWR